jgi:hypothetical protein
MNAPELVRNDNAGWGVVSGNLSLLKQFRGARDSRTGTPQPVSVCPPAYGSGSPTRSGHGGVDLWSDGSSL